MELRWTASYSASCLHAAEAVAAGRRLVNRQLAEILSEPARLLDHEIGVCDLPRERFWAALIALSAQIDNNRELAVAALRKTVGTSTSDRRLAGRIADVEAAVRRANPLMVEQLGLRVRPMREQWEARGPGLLAAVGRMTDTEIIVPRADVVLVHPVLGGSCSARLMFNSVQIEAMLVNPVPELPETVRLGWGLSQLNLDLPRFSDPIDGSRLARLAGLAMLPVILTAGEEVELTRCDEASVRRALDVWGVEVSSADNNPIELLLNWWDTYRDGGAEFAVALAALDRMLTSD